MSKTYHIFMPLQATPSWLALAPDQRHAFMSETVGPILEKHAEVRLRYFECEFFAAHISDIAFWETKDLGVWQSLVEHLRETPMWNAYFEVKDILLSVENAYAEHYDASVVSG